MRTDLRLSPTLGLRQLRALGSVQPKLHGMATALEIIFDGCFEKTCTPEIAKDYAGLLRADLQRIKRIVRLLEAYGDDQIGVAR